MKAKDIQKAGIPAGPLLKLALSLMGPAAQAGLKKSQIMARLRSLVAAPDAFLDDPLFGSLAKAMNVAAADRIRHAPAEPEAGVHAGIADAGSGNEAESAPWRMWGSDLDRAAIDQMRNACRLPVAVQGALMPDAHSGYRVRGFITAGGLAGIARG
jgi:tRNA-splicing ligase RtcB